MVVRFDGVIEQANDAALQILERERGELLGRRFAAAFFTDDENDAFIQSVLDAVYEKGRRQESYVPYRRGGKVKQLRIVSSCLHEDERVIGVILLISDITELSEMRDAIRAMNTIQSLNRQLELRNRVLQETFGRYLSDDVVREILDSPGGWQLGGQKRRLTVLMSDLRGFTAMSERMEPQALVSMLNHYFALMYEEIERFRGTLIEFLGDGMMVIFGAPAESSSHAADAAAAAIGMQRRMKEVNLWNAEHGYEPLGMGIGINTDTVILGNIGSEKRTKYGVLGAAVNLTGRIESYTTAGQILISSSTREAIGAELGVRRTLRVLPKGMDREITLYDICALGAPYAIALESGEKPPLRPLVPVTLRYTLLDGKHAEGGVRETELLALSDDEALLGSGTALGLYDNIRIVLGDGLYAKVTDIRAEGVRVCFTAKPPEFAAWRDALWGASSGRKEAQP